MRQVWITRHGGPEVLAVREAPDPEPGPGEVRLRVRAAGVNFADLMARKGLYPDAPPPPCVVGYEVAGDVDAVGPGVTAFQPGDRAFGITRFGGYASAVCVPEEQLFPMPEGMDYATAAAIPVNYLTAYAALVVMGNVRAGQRVLIQNAGGGVGLAAIDIGRILGAELIGTASAWKHATLRERGLHHAIDYRHEDVVATVRTITQGRGVDVVLDPIGGQSWAQGLALLKPLGRLVCYGVSTLSTGRRRTLRGMVRWLLRSPWLKFTPVYLMNHNQGVLGINLGHLWDERDSLRAWMLHILRWYEEGHIAPRVDKTFPLEHAAAAHTYIEERRNLGKVILVP